MDSCPTAKERIEHFSHVLATKGIGVGDRIAYLGLDHPMLLVALFATVRLGAIFNPINYRLSDRELIAILRHSEPSVILTDAGHDLRVRKLCANWERLQQLPFASLSADWRKAESFSVSSARFSELAPALPSDPALLVYTSGSTGAPKGVVLSHANLWSSSVCSILGYNLSERDVGLNCAPLFHAAGLNTLSLPMLMAGGELVLQAGFKEEAYISAIEKHKVTVGLMVPTMMARLAQHERFATSDLTSLRLLMTGGAPVPSSLLRTYLTRGIPASQSYGMTETTSAVLIMSPDQAFAKIGSCGHPTIMAEVKLIGGDGLDVKHPNVAGELCIRGPTTAKGYWNSTEITSSTLDGEGWLHSGDAAYFDSDGFYYICDRIKDMIVTGGENVYAAEVEHVLCGHPSVLEVAVVGRPDERWGECVVAFVTTRRGISLTLEELISFAEGKLARFKHPRKLYLIDELPRTSAGKLSKPTLRKFLSDEGLRPDLSL